MSARLTPAATIPVRPINYQQGTNTPVGNSTPIDVTVKDILIQAFAAIPNQADATTTVAAIVTTLRTLP